MPGIRLVIVRLTKCSTLTGPMVSDNGCLMLFVGGFKSAVEKHGDEIMKFLG